MNYKQSDITGTTWTRCRTVTINNPLPGKGSINIVTGQPVGPNCVFLEETALSTGTEILTFDSGGCQTVYVPDSVITLLDPTTGNPTGETVTQAKLYQILYSLYLATATARDSVE
jgi:hypothetical protein